MNSFLQRSRTLSSKPSSWDLIFSYSRSACWLFLLWSTEQLSALRQLLGSEGLEWEG